MGQLIDDLLQFSRLGRQPLRKVPTDMTALVREVQAELRRAGAGAGGRLPPRAACPRRRRTRRCCGRCGSISSTTRSSTPATGSRAEIAVSGTGRGRRRGLLRQGQRRRVRHEIRRQAVRGLSAPAPRGGVRGDRGGAGPGAAHRAPPRRPGLGRGGAGPRRDVSISRCPIAERARRSAEASGSADDAGAGSADTGDVIMDPAPSLAAGRRRDPAGRGQPPGRRADACARSERHHMANHLVWVKRRGGGARRRLRALRRSRCAHLPCPEARSAGPEAAEGGRARGTAGGSRATPVPGRSRWWC